LAKKKRGRPPKVAVKSSKPHRKGGKPNGQKGHGWVSGYWRKKSKPHRNKAYKRNKRRTKKEITRKGTRKQERTKKKREQVRKANKPQYKSRPQRKTVQKTFGKPKGPAKIR